MKVCVVISSIGKTQRLRGLLESLVSQDETDFEVGVCDQSPDGSVSRIADEFREQLDIFVTRSPRGLSAGRNSVVGQASPDTTHFIFPNDTSCLPSSTMSSLGGRHATADIVAMTYVDNYGARYTFEPGSGSIDFVNVWKIIEPAMVLSRAAIDAAGGFDESLGTGSSSPWQSGEGTDLLLKLVDRGLLVAWDPGLQVWGVSENHGLERSQYLGKLRAYGRGYGRVHAKWSYPLHRRLMICIAPWIRTLIPGTKVGLQEATAIFLGRLEGLLGQTVGR